MHLVYCKRMLIMHYSKRGCYYANTNRDKATNLYLSGKYITKIQLHLVLIWTSLIKLYYFYNFILLFSNAHWNLVLNLASEEDVFEIGAIKRIFSNEKKIRMNNVFFLLEKKTSYVIFVD